MVGITATFGGDYSRHFTNVERYSRKVKMEALRKRVTLPATGI